MAWVHEVDQKSPGRIAGQILVLHVRLPSQRVIETPLSMVRLTWQAPDARLQLAEFRHLTHRVSP